MRPSISALLIPSNGRGKRRFVRVIEKEQRSRALWLDAGLMNQILYRGLLQTSSKINLVNWLSGAGELGYCVDV